MPKDCSERTAEWRRARAARASRQARINRRQRLMESAKRFKNKAEAYAVGYCTGYNAAYRLHKRRARQEQAS